MIAVKKKKKRRKGKEKKKEKGKENGRLQWLENVCKYVGWGHLSKAVPAASQTQAIKQAELIM